MMKDCHVIRVLNRRGDELLFNIMHPNAAQKEYQDYIQVAQEFFEFTFLTQEEKQFKENQIKREKDAVQGEMDRI